MSDSFRAKLPNQTFKFPNHSSSASFRIRPSKLPNQTFKFPQLAIFF